MKVSKKAKALLRQAIDEKWKPIRARKKADNGIDNCALCRRYYQQGCSRCPIFKKTREKDCHGTPYWGWRRHQDKVHGDWSPYGIGCSACKRFVTIFINWLEALYSELTTH